MKVVVASCEDSDGYKRQILYIDEIVMESIAPLCECPEDAIIGRSLVSCGDIVHYMRLAYEVGKSGEEVTFEIRKMTDDD